MACKKQISSSASANSSSLGRRWGGLGGYSSRITFVSYGVDFGNRTALVKAVPPSHKKFLSSLPWVIEHPDYIFVHSGLDEKTSVDEQLQQLYQKDIRLKRVPWLCSKAPMVGPDDLNRGRFHFLTKY
jgi:serine/threonine protein phosphatase 1